MATRAVKLELPDDFPDNFHFEEGKNTLKSVKIELPTAEDFSDFGVRTTDEATPLDKNVLKSRCPPVKERKLTKDEKKRALEENMMAIYEDRDVDIYPVGPYVTPPITPSLPSSFATSSYDPPPMNTDPMQLYFEPLGFSTPRPPPTFATCSTVTFEPYTDYWPPYIMDPSYQLYQEVPEIPGIGNVGPSWDRKHDWDFITRAKDSETSGITDDTTEEVPSSSMMKEKSRPKRLRFSCIGTPREFQPQEYVDFMNNPIPEDPTPDTREIMNNLKRKLSEIEISQAVFAEKILGRSQGTLCDLLKNPKPWAELRCGKETYTRIYNWMRLDEDVGKELCWLPTEEVAKVIGKGFFGKRTRGCDGSSHPYGNPKRPRYRFNEEQRAQLLRIESSPTKTRVKEISRELSIPIESVKNFFKNSKRHRRCL